MIFSRIFQILCLSGASLICASAKGVFVETTAPNELLLQRQSNPIAYSNYVYVIAFPFSIDGRQFFYQSDLVPNDLERCKWFIQELLPDGRIGVQTANGTWSKAYDVMFPFAIAGKQYLYGQNLNDRTWILQELLPGGRMGNETARGSWGSVYESVFPFNISGRQFFYGKNTHSGHWFIQELLPGGKMGSETANGDTSVHEAGYEAAFPFSIDGKQYFYRQRINLHDWVIQELLADGKMGKETAKGKWIKAYENVFGFSVDGKQFFYGQSLYDHNWFIQELKSGGKMGTETATGNWQTPFEFSFAFSFNSTQFFYRQNIKDRRWIVQTLLPGGKMGNETASGDWESM